MERQMARTRDKWADQALLFDTFGTVVDGAAASPGGRRFPAPARRPAARGQLAFAAGNGSPNGRRSFTRLDVLHRENLERVLEAWNLDPKTFATEELDDLNRAWHRLDPWPDSVEGLRRLREHYLVAPLSNGNILLLTNMAKRAGIPWDCILGAEVVRAYKPQPSSYLATAEVLGLQPEECMLVAAHNSDLEAASAVGLRTAFVLRETEHGPLQTTDLGPTGPWDVVASDMIDLAEQLGAGPLEGARS